MPREHRDSRAACTAIARVAATTMPSGPPPLQTIEKCKVDKNDKPFEEIKIVNIEVRESIE